MISRAVFPVNLTFLIAHFSKTKKKQQTIERARSRFVSDWRFNYLQFHFISRVIIELLDDIYILSFIASNYIHSVAHIVRSLRNVIALTALFSRAIPLTQSNDKNYSLDCLLTYAG